MTTVIHTDDLLDQLANIPADSALASARQTREATTLHAQGSYQALFERDDGIAFSHAERFHLAALVAQWHQDPLLAEHYRSRLASSAALNDSERLSAATVHAQRLSFTPALAGAEHLHQLQQAGWSLDAIVTLSQLVAFVSFQSRLLRGLRLLAGHNDGAPDTPPVAAAWRLDAQTHSGKSAPVAFTVAELGWEPWIAAKPLAEFSTEQQSVLAKHGHSDSDYFRLLGRNLPVLDERTLTDKGIFFTSGGLPRQERELAAAVASKINGCIFCASVHARKAAQLSKQHDAVQRLIATAPGEVLTAGQSERWQALIAFAAALSTTPASAASQPLLRLRELGLNELELLDLVQSTAFFAWANRLMLTLGEPFLPQ